MNKKFKIKKGDTVIIITGKDKGKTGDVLSINKVKNPKNQVDEFRNPCSKQ